jgi:hypothetical protein
MTLDRRQFVTALAFSSAAATLPISGAEILPVLTSQTTPPNANNSKVDFRFAPRHSQSTICFPDDPRKTIVGQAGNLR